MSEEKLTVGQKLAGLSGPLLTLWQLVKFVGVGGLGGIIQAVLQYIFPLMIVWWGRSFPAGLTIYWFVGTLFMCVQQHFVLSRLKKQRLKKEEEEKYRKEHPELFPEVVEEEKPVKPSEVKIIEEEDEEVFEEKTELEEVEDEYADFYTEEELLQMKKQQEAARKKSKYKKKK